MTDDNRIEQLLLESIEIQSGMLKLLALARVVDENSMTEKAIKLRKDFGFSEDLLTAITGVRSDNLRRALKREGLL